MLSYWAASRGWPRIDIANAWGTVSAWVERRWPEIEACAAVLKRRGVDDGREPGARSDDAGPPGAGLRRAFSELPLA